MENESKAEPAPLPARGFIDPVVVPVIDHWSHFRCGSYTAEWVSRAVGIENTPSNFLLPGPVWFDLFRPVIPSDMRKLFKAKGMSTVEVHLSNMTLEERLNWIKTEIVVHRRPPVLLIRTATLHWTAVGGYDDDKRVLYIYDARIGHSSLDTDYPIGNATMSYDDLNFLWSGRFIWKYVAIIVTSIYRRELQKEKAEAILEAYARGELVHKDKGVENKLRSLG